MAANEPFSFGIRLKGLVGLADIKMNIENYLLPISEGKTGYPGKGYLYSRTPITIDQ